MNFTISGTLNQEYVDLLLDILNQIESNEELSIYINLQHGGTVFITTIKDILENQTKGMKINLILYGENHSLGGMLFFNTKVNGYKKILPLTSLIYGRSFITANILPNGKPIDYSQEYLQLYDETVTEYHKAFEKYKLGISEEQLAIVEKGDVIHLNDRTLTKLLSELGE